MPVITPDDLADLQTTTTKFFERRRFTEIATDLREYHVFPNLVLFGDEKKGTSRMETRNSGTAIEWKVMVNHSGASRHVGLATPDEPVKTDVMMTATAPWRNTTTQYGMIQQEITMNSAQPQQIVNILDIQDKAALISLAVLMENTYWGSPVDSSDEVTPYGFFTWFPKSASTGFVGAFPSGFTTLGLSTQHPRWKHYVDAYTNPTADDLIRKMDTAILLTHFMNPVAGIPNLDAGLDRCIYTNTTTYISLREECQNRNDNLGYDFAYGQGNLLFHNVPIKIVPKLDADTTNPVIGQDWATMKCIALAPWWLKRYTEKNRAGQHTTDAYYIDSTYNFVTWNRRKNWVMATGTTYPS